MRNYLFLAGAAIVVTSLPSATLVQAEEKFSYIEIDPLANRKLLSNLGSGAENNSLSQLPTGEQVLGGIKFKIGPAMIQLGSKWIEDYPESVAGIAVNRKLAKLHVLHATCYGRGTDQDEWHVKDGTLIGQYMVHFEDGSTEGIPIVYGEDVRDWWYSEGEAEPSKGKVVWKGDNPVAAQVGAHLRLYASSWANPKPDKKVTRIDYVSRKGETVAAPFCIAISAEQ